jgi:hypothetical protein
VSATIGNFWVLPNQVLLCEPADCNATAGIPTVTGTPNTPLPGNTKLTIPNPQVVVSFPVAVYAVELQVKFRDSKGSIIDAFEDVTDRSTQRAWTSFSTCQGELFDRQLVTQVNLRGEGVVEDTRILDNDFGEPTGGFTLEYDPGPP